MAQAYGLYVEIIVDGRSCWWAHRPDRVELFGGDWHLVNAEADGPCGYSFFTRASLWLAGRRDRVLPVGESRHALVGDGKCALENRGRTGPVLARGNRQSRSHDRGTRPVALPGRK